jgi:GT2 family glycosyltransferase
VTYYNLMTDRFINKKDVAVVILNWNGIKFLKKFLKTLINNTDSEIASIYVVDNNSKDDSLEYLKNFPEVSIISLEENFGFAGGYNKGLEKINSKYFLLLNSDIETLRIG